MYFFLPYFCTIKSNKEKTMATTENNGVKSRKDAVRERLSGKRPELNMDDEEAVYGAISEDYDDYDKQLGDYQGREKQLSDMFSSDPRSAAFLMNWKNGGDPAVELVRQFGTDIKDAIDDPEKLDAIAEANKEFVGRVAKEKELEETYQQNMKQTLQTLDEVQKKHGLSDEEVDAAMEMLMQVVKDGVMGKFTTESIEMAMKAINHDADVDDAAREAEVRGKNQRVKEELRKPKMGDGTAQLNGKTNAGAGRMREKTIFDLANEAG